MDLKAADRLSSIQPFRVMALLARANELAQEGHDVIHMEVGEPDFPTPGPIVRAARECLDQGGTRYTDARGVRKLREAVSAHYAAHLDAAVSPDRIFLTAGASGGLLLVTALLMNAGENLLMTDPGYPCNRHFLSTFGAEGRLVPVTHETGYQLTATLLDQYWDEKSRGILVASPANPTGSILDETSLAALTTATRNKGGFTIVDEIYQGLVYGKASPGTVLNIDDDAIVVNSFSKYFGMTGWRLGWVVLPEHLSGDFEKLAQNLFICPSAISQQAALAAFSDESRAIMESQRHELESRRDYLVPALRELGFDVPRVPEGAFYVYAGLPEGFNDSEAFCQQLLEQYYVAITPGTDFGFHSADQMVRFSYAAGINRLQEAVRRIGSMLS